MQKFYNLFLLFLAVLLIVLHNVTPHAHEHMEGNQNIVKISAPQSGLSGSGLFIDLGGDHLEAFSQCRNFSSDKIVTNSNHTQISPLVFWLEYPIDVANATRPIPLYLPDYQGDIFLSVCVSRGPPIVG